MMLLPQINLNPWRHFDRFLVAKPSWAPAFDISETDEAFVLRGDLPGVAQDDIEIRVEDNVLTVNAEREAAQTDNDCCHCRVERRSGKFGRAFTLPENVDSDQIKASYKNGVIELVLAKQEPVDNSRLIPVH